MSIVMGAFGTVTKGLQKGLEDWKLADEWRPTKLLHYSERSEYWEEYWRLEETCCHSHSCETASANADVKNSDEELIIIILIIIIIAMMLLNLTLRKYTAGYKLSKSQEKINHRHERHQTICKKSKRTVNSHTRSLNIQ